MTTTKNYSVPFTYTVDKNRCIITVNKRVSEKLIETYGTSANYTLKCQMYINSWLADIQTVDHSTQSDHRRKKHILQTDGTGQVTI